ncbi:MAG: hypothetical protein ACKPBT_06725 [Microcystis aeruginosa]
MSVFSLILHDKFGRAQIKQTTQTIEKSLDEVNKKITTELSQEQLKAKIKELLGKVTGVLQSQPVKDALNKGFFRTYNVENSPSSLSVQQCSKVDKYQSNKNSKPYYTSFTSISC